MGINMVTAIIIPINMNMISLHNYKGLLGHFSCNAKNQ